MSWAMILLCLVGGTALAGADSDDSPLFILNTASAASVGQEEELPQRNRLGECYPNPFNPLTSISFELSSKTTVDLRIYDLQGRLVRSLIDQQRHDGGAHEAQWNGRDGQGQSVAAGVYIYRLETEGYVASRRMTLVK